METLKEKLEMCKLHFDDIDSDYAHESRESYLRFLSNIKNVLHINADKTIFTNLMKISCVNKYLIFDNTITTMANVEGDGAYERSCIYVTLHLGTFQVIPDYLLSKGVRLCIPVTNQVFENQVNIRNSDFDIVRSRYAADFKFVDIEETSGLIKLIRYAKEGYSILIYIDGNSGIGGMGRTDEKLLSLNLVHQEIMVRKGIGYLSSHLNLPVVPVVTYLDGNLQIPNIHFLPPMVYKVTSVEKYMCESRIIEQLWEAFQTYIVKYTDQWEGWLYVNLCFKNKQRIVLPYLVDKYFTFNADRYDFLIKEERIYLYDLYNNILIKISESLFKVFQKMRTNNISFSIVQLREIIRKNSLVEDIIQQNILINK